MGDHRSCRSLSVSTGNTDGILIAAHYSAPGLCTFEYRYSLCVRGGNLGIIIMNCSSSYNKVCTVNAFGQMSDGDLYSLFAQSKNSLTLVHVRTGNVDAHTQKHFAKCRHGYTANTYQMPFFTGLHIFEKIRNVHFRLRNSML